MLIQTAGIYTETEKLVSDDILNPNTPPPTQTQF